MLYPAVSTNCGKYPFLVRFYLFLARCDLVCPGLAQKHRRLATVPARGCCGTTKGPPQTSKRPTNGPDALKRDQHTTGLGSVITAYHEEMERHYEFSRSWAPPMSCFHSSPSAPNFRTQADTDTLLGQQHVYKSCYSCGLPIKTCLLYTSPSPRD